jgi:hypothetical protein
VAKKPYVRKPPKGKVLFTQLSHPTKQDYSCNDVRLTNWQTTQWQKACRTEAKKPKRENFVMLGRSGYALHLSGAF